MAGFNFDKFFIDVFLLYFLLSPLHPDNPKETIKINNATNKNNCFCLNFFLTIIISRIQKLKVN